jgi:hypothetical protein
MQLLLTVPEILDEENAPEIPLVSSTLSKYSSADATDQPMRSIHKAAGAGVSVEFKGSFRASLLSHFPSLPQMSSSITQANLHPLDSKASRSLFLLEQQQVLSPAPPLLLPSSSSR